MSKLNPLAIVLLVVGIGSFAAVLAYSSYYATSYAGWNWQQQNQYPNQNQGQMMRQLTQTQAYTSASSPITMDQAKAIAEQYLSSVNNPNLAIHEIMEFQNNFYIIYYEKDTARGAFEMLIWKQAPSSGMMGGGMGMGMGGGMMTGVIMPEPGPNMMWNTKYSQMGGGMMGGQGMGWNQNQATGAMSVTKEKALQIAQTYLDQNLNGAKVEEDAMQFYGYYTMDFTVNGKIAGMLSVNGQTGQVWYHSWHGVFIQEVEYD
jgi:hypothetical protein